MLMRCLFSRSVSTNFVADCLRAGKGSTPPIIAGEIGKVGGYYGIGVKFLTGRVYIPLVKSCLQEQVKSLSLGEGRDI